jgi:alkaline phosphatase D
VTVSRREFLAGLAAAAAVAGCSGSDDAEGGTAGTGTTGDAGTSGDTGTTAVPTTGPPPLDDRFALGVASGDPDATSVALWTRLLDVVLEDDVAVRWEVATDASFAEIVAAGDTVAGEAFGHSVHVVADRLDPGSRYRYRFLTDAGSSPVGTTRTAPSPEDATTLRLAVASCQRYGDGYFAAHRDLAAADVDVVLFLGDFVYESVGGDVRPLPGGAATPAVDLAGYRSRYEAARSDPDLAACAAAHPWVVTWDDHEVANNYAGTSESEDRRAAGYQAWWEHQPTRLPAPEGASLAVHRSLTWGSTAEVVVLDCRQYRVPGETMLGAEQKAWALERIAGASAAWTVLAGSVIFSPVAVGETTNADAWDGFAAERDELAAALRSGGAAPMALAGDVHVEVVLETPGSPPIPELVCPSISSGVGSLGPFVAQLPSLVPNVHHAKDARGWLRVDLTPDAATARYREVVGVDDSASPVVDGTEFSFRT